jgi:branched-chain amino acid transport system substrate-binding protein
VGGLKIGILIPKSDMYPTLGMDLLNGLKLAFSKAEAFLESPTFVIENIGVAADDQVLRSAEKLILQEDVDLSIAFCGVLLLPQLARLQEQYKRPLIHLDLGGRVYNKEHCNPYVLHHTLNLWQSSYAAGQYAAEHFGKKCLLAVSFYDGAYHMTETFNRGFASKGGSIAKFFVANADYKQETFEGLFRSIQEEEPDFIYGIFSYKEGVKFLKAYANSEYNDRIPIVANPSLTDEAIASEDYDIQHIESIASWSFDDEDPTMQNFISEYKSLYQIPVSVISLLGYEVGLTLGECLTTEGTLIARLEDALIGKSMHTPRGMLKYNLFNESQIDEFKIRKFEFNEVQYHNNITGTINSSFTEKLQEELKELPANGWQNPYLCT